MASSNTMNHSASDAYDVQKRPHEPDDTLSSIPTAGSMYITPEMFEKLYLSPQNRVKGDVRQMFGNPTPIAVGGFLMALSPLSNVLLGWRGSGLFGAAETAVYFFFGGLLMILGGVMEFFLGNTFPSIVFTTFGAFWLSYGGTLQPYFNAVIAYDPQNPALAVEDPEFGASFGFFMVYMAVLCFVFMIGALRTNLVFFALFLVLIPTFSCLAASFWHAAEGNATLSVTYMHAAGGLAFTVCLVGWYLFLAQVLAAVDFPISLPVVDLSQVIKGGRERRKNEEQETKA